MIDFGGIPYKILSIVSILLFVAVAPMPYGFYTFVKMVVCGCAGVICYQLWSKEYRGIWLWVWGMVAIFFNPIASIHMTKEIWMIVDGVAGCLFGYATWMTYRKPPDQGDPHDDKNC